MALVAVAACVLEQAPNTFDVRPRSALVHAWGVGAPTALRRAIDAALVHAPRMEVRSSRAVSSILHAMGGASTPAPPAGPGVNPPRPPCPPHVVIAWLPSSGSTGLEADHERHLEPLPVAVDVVEAVLEMMDRHRRDDGVEAAQVGQRIDEVVPHELDALVAGVAPARRLAHEVGEVQADAAHLRAIGPQKRERPSIPPIAPCRVLPLRLEHPRERRADPLAHDERRALHVRAHERRGRVGVGVA